MSGMSEFQEQIIQLEQELEETKKALNQALSREARLRKQNDKLKGQKERFRALAQELLNERANFSQSDNP